MTPFTPKNIAESSVMRAAVRGHLGRYGLADHLRHIMRRTNAARAKALRNWVLWLGSYPTKKDRS